MLQPPQDVDTLFEDVWQDLPPETVQMARECTAFTRARKINTPVPWLRLVLRYGGLDQSRREVAGPMTLLVGRITESAVAERLAACRPWVRALLPRLLGQPVLAALPPQRRLLVIDGSGVHAPGARGTPYRLHLCLERVTLTLVSVTMTDKHPGESLRPVALGPGDVVVADRGYGHPATIVQPVQQGTDVRLRLTPHNVPVTHDEGTPVDWRAVLARRATARVGTRPVPLAVTGATPVPRWVHVAPLPEAQANNARRLCRPQRRKQGHQPRPQTLLLAGWVLVLTSLPPTWLSGPTALALYRVRWQIAIAITRWKSVLDVDLWRARSESPLADVWWHGKLRYARLLDHRLRRLRGEPWRWLDRPRTTTWWRPWKLLQAEVIPRMTGSLSWQPADGAICRQVLAERPRRRPLPRRPQEVSMLLARSDTSLQPALAPAIAA